LGEPGQDSGGLRTKMQFTAWGQEELAQIGRESQELGERVKALQHRINYLVGPEGLVKAINLTAQK
jgi:hypothetical protein